MSEVKIFLENMFDYFREITKYYCKEFYRYLHYEKDYSYRFEPFLNEMQYFDYDVKNAVISMTTKYGEIYDLNQLLEFNKKHSDYLEIIGVGNEASSINHDAGGAVIEFQVNKEYFANDILDIQKAVRCVEIVDDFDVYPMGIIEKRVIKKLKRRDMSEIKLIGDYAKGCANKDSVIELVADINKSSRLDIFNFRHDFDELFKCKVKVYFERDVDLEDEDVLIISV